MRGIKKAFFSPLLEVRRTRILSPYRYRTVTRRKGLLSGPSCKLGMVLLVLDCLGFLGRMIEISRKGTLLLTSAKHSD